MRAFPLALVLALSATAHASAAEPADAFVTDLGFMTCAKWLSTPELKRDGDHWLQGYLTFDNPLAKYPLRIARLANVEALMDEVRKGCARSDRTLFEVAHGVRELVLQGAISLAPPASSATQK